MKYRRAIYKFCVIAFSPVWAPPLFLIIASYILVRLVVEERLAEKWLWEHRELTREEWKEFT